MPVRQNTLMHYWKKTRSQYRGPTVKPWKISPNRHVQNLLLTVIADQRFVFSKSRKMFDQASVSDRHLPIVNVVGRSDDVPETTALQTVATGGVWEVDKIEQACS
jgi:hypothetical protein